jgi:hypothetical protein
LFFSSVQLCCLPPHAACFGVLLALASSGFACLLSLPEIAPQSDAAAVPFRIESAIVCQSELSPQVVVMDKAYWSRACNAQLARTSSDHRQANAGSGIFAVRLHIAYIRVCLFNLLHSRLKQIVLYCLAAAFSGTWLALWVRLLHWKRNEGADLWNDRIWLKLGQFCALVCAASVAGAIALGARMQTRNISYDYDVSPITDRLNYGLRATRQRVFVAFDIFQPLQLLLTLAAMSMLLRRVVRHASHGYYIRARDEEGAEARGRKSALWEPRDCIGEYALAKWHRGFSSAVFLLNVVSVVARMALIVFRLQRAHMADLAATACDSLGGATQESWSYMALENNISKFNGTSAESAYERSGDIATSVSRSCEAVALFIMCAAYLIFFPVSIVMFARVERRLAGAIQEMSHRTSIGDVFLPFEFSSNSTEISADQTQVQMEIGKAREFLGSLRESAAQQRLRFFWTCAIMLITLLATSVSAALRAFFAQFDKVQPDCGRCDACQHVNFLINECISNTSEILDPVLQCLLPLPLIATIWLMMTKLDRRQLLSNVLQRKQPSILHLDEGERKHFAESVRMGIYME